MEAAVIRLALEQEKVLGLVVRWVFIGMMDYPAQRKWLPKAYCGDFVGLAAVVVHWLSPASFPLAVARTRRPISRASCDTEAAKTTPDHFIGHAVVFGNLGARFSRQIP
jgi:hypothetical protein